MQNKVGFVGNGNIGAAVGRVFKDNGWTVEYFDTAKDKRTVNSLPELAEVSDLIIIAAPSWTNREIATKLKPEAKGKLIVTLAKGVEAGFVTMDKVLSEVADGDFDYGVINGPMLAVEISKGQPASMILASTSSKRLKGFDKNSQLRVEYSDDPYSVALCGVLKNIYAVTVGINDGLGLGHNAKGALAVSIIDEFSQLMKDLSGDPAMTTSLAGIGDLLATGWSDLSFNHRIGRLIGKDPSTEPRGEGVSSLREIVKVIKPSDYPLLSATYKIVEGKLEPAAIKKLI